MKTSGVMLLLIFFTGLQATPERNTSDGPNDYPQQITLFEAIQQIGRHYHVLFNYDREIIPDIMIRYEPDDSRTVDEAISVVLENTELKYHIFNYKYVVIYKDDEKGIESLREMIQHFQKIVDDKDEIVAAKREVRSVPRLTTHVPLNVWQSKRLVFTVEGTVTDQEGEPLIGVNIQVKGSGKGTATDFDGRFELEDIDENAVLVVSYVGYQTQEIPVAGKSNLRIVMVSDSQLLDEVVVVGYGTQRKENVIGSITSVKSEELTSSPVGRVSNALAGRLPGGIFMQESGEPGNDASTIRVRGNSTFNENSPLVVIDGIPGRDLNSLNPEDIESISVLKDASAAIYGARAANGVILVTTKSGGKDSPASFTYNVYQGFLSPSKLPEMTDAPTYARMIREMQSYREVDESNMIFSEEDIAKYESGEYPWTHPNTDWQAEALKNYSSTQHHNLSVGGGTSKISYFGSFGSQFDDGIYTNSATSFNRYNLKLNLNAEINRYLSLGLNISGVQENRNYPTKSANSIFQGMLRMYPTSLAVIPGTDLPGPDIEYGDQPMVSASDATGFDQDKRYRSDNILSANLKIPGVEGLTLSGYYAYDMYIRHRKLFQKPWTLYSLDETAYLNAGNTGRENGLDFVSSKTIGYSEPRLTNSSQDAQTKTFNAKLGYENTFGIFHNLDAFIAYEQSEYHNDAFEAFRRFFISDQLPYLFAGGDAEKDNNESVGLDSRVNYFGRASYNFNHTYYLQFSFRRDGSLRFSEENGRWGNFPSLLVGYRPSQQDWWKDNIGFINDFKIRASWGKLGNDQVKAFQYLTNYGFSSGYTFGDGREFVSGLNQTNTPNPFITWEVSNMYNLGIEVSMLDQKLNLEADVFYENRNDILVQRDVSVPKFTGMTLPDENFGRTTNRGLEMLLSYRNNYNYLNYSLSGNFAFSRNKVVEMDEPERPVPWQVRTGHPMDALLIYKMIGVFSDWEQVNSMPHVTGARPGDIIIEDFDGDGEITTNDRQLFPYTTVPEITYGFTFDLGYKNWELRGLLQGQGRAWRYIYSDDRHGSGGNYFQWDADGRWTPDNINASKPRAYERLEEYWRKDFETDYNYADVSFLRLKNLQIGYNLPFVQKTGIISKLKLYASGQNLWLIHSGNKIMDPETASMGAYPIMKVLSVGAQIIF